MTKFYFASLFILFFSFGFSQSYPYLNASTANRGEYPVDKDTNIYMFQGGRLTKTDKNFNVVWSYTYTGMNFTHILLLKTGSMFFLSGTPYSNARFGKINANGSLAWERSVYTLSATISSTTYPASNVNCNSIFLDRSNNLVISGTHMLSNSKAFLLKTDTNGAPLKYKCFNLNYSENFGILRDSSGIYKCVGTGGFLGGTALGIYNYSDITDAFTFSEWTSALPYSANSYIGFYRSKVSNCFYMTASNTGTMINVLYKVSDAGYVWGKSFSPSSMGPNIFNGGMVEDEKGNIFYSLTCGPACTSYTSAFVKLDSNGVANSFMTTMLNGYYVGTGFPPPIPSNSPRVIHNNNYYFDVYGYSFSMNPLTVQKFNSSLNYSCSSSLAISSVGYGLSFFMTEVNPTIIPISSYTLPSFPMLANPTTTSINPNFCTVVSLENNAGDRSGIEIYPNPAQDKLYISEKNYAVGSVEVFDVNGKSIKSIAKDSSIDISNLPNGIYFIRIKADKGEFNKRFVKN